MTPRPATRATPFVAAVLAAALAASLALTLGPTVAHAQTVHGVVVEEGTSAAISGAHVEFVGSDGRRAATARTDRAGAFLVRLRQADSFTIRLSHLGYAAVESDTVAVAPNESVSLELRMATAAIPLEPLVVRARGDNRGVGGFHERRLRPGADGHFITRETIERRKGVWATNLLHGIPNVYLHQARCGTAACGNLILMRGLGIVQEATPDGGYRPTVTDQCEPTVYVDGTRMPQGESLDMFLRPDDLEAVEVYPRGVGAPPPILAQGACGVVAFWTREDDLGRFSWRRLGAWLGGMAAVFSLTRL